MGHAEDEGFLWEDDVVVAKVLSVVIESTGGSEDAAAPRPRWLDKRTSW